MFSQFRQAVESLAQPLQDDPSSENALANIRKSITAQRAASPARQSAPRPRSASPGPSSAKNSTDSGLRKTTLEERLRASFALSESSGATTPIPSRNASPTLHSVPVTQHPLSPTSTPLPDSPSTAAPLLDTPVHAEGPKDTDDILKEPNGVEWSSSSDHRIDSTTDPRVVDDPPHAEESNEALFPPNDGPSTTSLTDRQDSIDHTDGTHNNLTVATEPLQAEDLEQQPSAHAFNALDSSTVDVDPPTEECISGPTTSNQQQDANIETLQQRLQLVEQRFTDVSTSFKKLQAERRDIDSVISELTPLSGSKNVEALREYLIGVNMKVELGQDELQRLSGKLTRQEERLEELRDTHRTEAASQLDRIAKLQLQLSEAEALVTASQSTAAQTEEANAKRDSEVGQLRVEVSKANETAKEEEEKRVKAISLLKTVRQKLVKAEKERDDALRELNETRDRNLEEKDRDRAERTNLEREIDTVNMEREKAITGLRAQFDKDISAARDRAERDIQTAKIQFESEINALKTSYSAEITANISRINTLENTMANLASENKSFFEQVELRQAELESSQCHGESLQAQNTELQFQLKELQERISLLNDEINELRGEHEMQSQVPGTSAEEISQLVSSTEIKYEAKLSELKRALTTAEKERTEAEASWSHRLTEKTKETEGLKRMLASSAQLREQDENMTGSLRAEIEKLQADARSQHGRLHELQTHTEAFKDVELTLQRRLSEAVTRAEDGEKQVDEIKSQEAQLRTQNKTLRDELRKIQNSVAVLERQRNPGAGYWTSRSEVADSRTSISSIPDARSFSSRPPTTNEQEINHEYLRNVILQFLEHKEMRPNLVRVLSTILHFTPQETRRLISKV